MKIEELTSDSDDDFGDTDECVAHNAKGKPQVKRLDQPVAKIPSDKEHTPLTPNSHYSMSHILPLMYPSSL